MPIRSARFGIVADDHLWADLEAGMRSLYFASAGGSAAVRHRRAIQAHGESSAKSWKPSGVNRQRSRCAQVRALARRRFSRSCCRPCGSRCSRPQGDRADSIERVARRLHQIALAGACGWMLCGQLHHDTGWQLQDLSNGPLFTLFPGTDDPTLTMSALVFIAPPRWPSA